MKAVLFEWRLHPCVPSVSHIMSYQSVPLWPEALCHLISSTRASCHRINKSLSRLDAVEIFILGRLKRRLAARGRREKRKGKNWSFVTPLAWLNFLICVSTLA